MINIIETKKLKMQLDENPGDYQAIINNSSLAICITNAEGNYFAVNENYCLLYGFHERELIGKSFLIVVPEQKHTQLKNTHSSFLKSKNEILRGWEVMNRNGEVFKIWADAGYNNKINNAPHKITFVQPVEEELANKLKENFEKNNLLSKKTGVVR